MRIFWTILGQFQGPFRGGGTNFFFSKIGSQGFEDPVFLILASVYSLEAVIVMIFIFQIEDN